MVSSLTLNELLTEIQEKYPHSLSNDSVIRKLDHIQKRLFRLFKKLVKTRIVSTPGQIWFEPRYRVGGDVIRPNDIREWIVEGMTYTYLDIQDEPLPYYYFYVDGKYGIMPQPIANTNIDIFHYYVPQTLVYGSTIEIEEDFQNMLIYGVCKEIAENYQDFDAANGYAVQYNYYVDEYMKYEKPVQAQTIKEEWWG